MENLGSYIATIVASLIVGYLSRYVEPRSKLLGWSTHHFAFNIPNQNATLQTNSLTIHNVGRRSAEGVAIVYKSKPDFFKFWPSVGYRESTNPNGEFVVTIDSLGSKEWVFVQHLNYTSPLDIRSIRWKEGQIRWVQVMPQRVWPSWIRRLMAVVFIVGLGTITYWLLRGAVAVFNLM